jgi:selenocysteine lyase/cysteine desulfurase
VERVRRREYADRDRTIFLNAASWGILPRSAAEEAAQLTLRRNRAGGFRDEDFGPIQRRCREAAARLIGVTPPEIALSPNTSFGVNLAAALVGSGPPGTILTSEGEFPANILPWKPLERRGFRVELVETNAQGWPDEDALLALLGRENVRALALSAVQYVSGYRADLEALGASCQAHGVLFCVDAIQALGAVPLDAARCGIDVLSCGGQKWLCSPWGSGFTYVRRELQERFDPPMVGWLSMKGGTRFEEGLSYGMEWVDDARKFELATLALQDYLGMARSIELFLEMEPASVEEHIRDVQAPLLEWIDARPDARARTPLDPARRAGIFTLGTGDVERAATALREADVIVSVREGGLRLAPHFYNTVEEMVEVVRILDGA